MATNSSAASTPRLCRLCGKPFPPQRRAPHKAFCSEAHRMEWHGARLRELRAKLQKQKATENWTREQTR